AAVARIEAKQRTVNRAPADTLPGATAKLIAQRSAVAGTISMNSVGKILERLPIMTRGQEFPQCVSPPGRHVSRESKMSLRAAVIHSWERRRRPLRPLDPPEWSRRSSRSPADDAVTTPW